MDGYPRTPDGAGFRIKTVEGFHIDILPMIFNHRIVTTPVEEDPLTACYTRYWCYPSALAAFAAVEAWDGSPDTEPVGWTKAYGERYPARTEEN